MWSKWYSRNERPDTKGIATAQGRPLLALELLSDDMG
jgi:hypothetical protein